VQRSEDGCDMGRFRSFNHSTCKTVLNLLEAVYLRLRKIVVERVTVVKFRVHNRGSNGTGRERGIAMASSSVRRPSITLRYRYHIDRYAYNSKSYVPRFPRSCR